MPPKIFMTRLLAKPVSSYLAMRRRLFKKLVPVNISGHLANARNVLLLLPRQPEQFSVAVKALGKLSGLKPAWKITVVSPIEMVGFIDKKIRVKILPFSKADVNVLGMPRTSVKRLIQDSPFDLALDFGFKFDLLTVMLLDASGAAVKACFNNKKKAPFYNLEIRVNPAESLDKNYAAFVKYVTLLSGSTTPKEKEVSDLT